MKSHLLLFDIWIIKLRILLYCIGTSEILLKIEIPDMLLSFLTLTGIFLVSLKVYFIEQVLSLKKRFYDKLNFRSLPCPVPILESQTACSPVY